MEQLDWIVIGLYFVLLLGIAAWVMSKKQKDTQDYFLAGRNVGWFVVGASIFASNIGSEHLVGLAGAGADSGMPLAHYELHAWIVLLLGWVFLPFYARSGVFTMPEFLERRYSPKARWFLSILSLIGYILTKVSVSIYAGGIVFQSLLGMDFWTGAILTLVITGIYTVVGGMRAVVYTEALQTFILIGGALAVTYIGLDHEAIGGWSGLKDIVGSSHFNMWRPADDPKYPWTGMVFGGAIVGIWYWCTDQYIVQRVLTARNVKEGRRGAIWGGFLKILPVFLFLVPGMVAFALSKQGVLQYNDANEVLPTMVKTLLPAGIRGLVAAGLLAALMSSLASVFNSCSTLFTIDIYKKLRPAESETRLLRIGKIATAVIVVLGFAWIPVMKNAPGTLYDYLQSVQSYIAPPITAVFLLGILSKRINAKGAMATLYIGFGIGLFRLVLDTMVTFNPGREFSGILGDIIAIPFSHFAIIIFVISLCILVGVSLSSAKPSAKQVEGLALGTLTDEQKADVKNSYSWVDIVTSGLIVVIITAIMLYFTG
ncbi:sodium:solute symporter [Sinomicrobium weinanense]|uniref:Sodium/solute symporter n=1 Tax=Sinomicrobium weinanense TaxID=2842200 RepID=A0A926JUG2_9FLAO|nr:sodium:solute symporter [Sinomicrobium weinanense]MBC9797406.1 sodium/solute symporter [Sinomicrobium weinanense]MBU3124561.1 sodium:solute symporter [Sinomicrobium weinanense]